MDLNALARSMYPVLGKDQKDFYGTYPKCMKENGTQNSHISAFSPHMYYAKTYIHVCVSNAIINITLQIINQQSIIC